MSDKVTMQVTGLDGVIKTLDELPREAVRGARSPIRKALALAARKFRTRARANMKAAIAINGSMSTGNTAKALIVKRVRSQSGERYIVAVKQKTFKNAKGIDTDTQMTARLLEWGSVHQPATPWLRPTGMELAPTLIPETSDDLRAKITALAESLAGANGVPK